MARLDGPEYPAERAVVTQQNPRGRAVKERYLHRVEDQTAQNIADAVVGIVQRELRGFEPADAAPDESGPFYTHRLPIAAVAYEGMFDLLFRSLGAFSEPAFDKTRWLYSFSLNGRSCRLRWTKSGIRLDLFGPQSDDHDEPADAAAIATRLLKAARSLYSRIVTPQLSPSIRAGRAVVLNQLPRYRGMVDFHRQTIERAKVANPLHVSGLATGKLEISEAIPQLFGSLLGASFRERDQSYRATALIAGYFAWVQHLLVILSSFSPAVLKEGFSLEDLLTGQWAQQFDIAFPKPHDVGTARLKMELGDLAREFRNPLLHGGGGRFEDGVVVEWAPGHESIAIDTDALTDQYMLLRPSLTEEQIANLLRRVDSIDAGFEQHPFFGWASEGLHADFRREFVERALQERLSGSASAFTDAASRAFDDSVNWDR